MSGWLELLITIICVLPLHEFGHYVAARRNGWKNIRLTLCKWHSIPVAVAISSKQNIEIENAKQLKEFLLKVKPDYYSISNYTFDGFKPVSKEFKEELKEIFKSIPFKVIYMF